MSFPTVEHLGREIALLLIVPNLARDDSHRIRLRYPVRIEEGESGRENREPGRESLSLEQTCAYTLRKNDAAALKAGLATLGNKLVGVPLWCDLLAGADWADKNFVPGYLVRMSDGAILAEGSALEATEFYAPLLVGKLRQRPDEDAWTEDGCQCEISVFESSPPEYKIQGAAVIAGEQFPEELEPTWTEVIERSADGLVYDQVGKIREVSIDGQEKATKWGQEAAFVLNGRDEIRSLIGFFETVRGQWKSFGMPVWFRPNPDTETTPHDTRARFAADGIELAFSGGSLASCQLAFWQVPWEIEPPEGEEAEQAAPAYLFKFIMPVPGGPLYWRFTDWERAIERNEDGAVSYTPGPFEFDRITQDFALEDDPTTILSRVFEENPLMLILRRILEAPLEIEIYRCDPDDPDNARQVYSGEVEDVTGTGRALEAPTSLLGGAFETKVPDFFVQVPCNWDFCDEGCGLDPDDWTFEGTLVSVDGLELVVAVTANPPGAALAGDYFAKAWIAKGSGETYEARDIVRSYDQGAGQQRFVLKRPFRDLEEGQTFTFRPNCGGTWSECKTKFANAINYGGHRHVQPDNPSLPTRETNVATGKK